MLSTLPNIRGVWLRSEALLGAKPMVISISAAVLLIALPLGCKPQPATTPSPPSAMVSPASVSALALVAASTPADPVCGLDLPTPAQLPTALATLAPQIIIDTAAQTEASMEALRGAIYGTLVAAPTPLLQLFFTAGQGQIQINATAAACSAVGVSKEQQEILGSGAPLNACWLAPTAQAPLRLVLKAEPAVIRANLLPLLAFVESEFFLTAARQPNASQVFGGTTWGAYANGFTTLGTKLAAAFLVDAAAARPTALAAYQRLASADADGFRNLAYSQLVAAYYCSTASRQRFQTTFKESWSVFTSTTDPLAPLRELGSSPLTL